MQRATASAIPVKRPGIGRFSDDLRSKRETVHAVIGSDRVLREILERGTDIQLGERLADGTRRNGGRERDAGSLILMYLDFVLTKEVNVQPWWKETTEAQWRDAGFDAKPSYRTVKRRFNELAVCEEALLDATAHIIRRANEHERGWIGHDLWFDATEAEDNVRLHHDCRADEPCARRERAAARAREREHGRRRGRLPAALPEMLRRATSLDVHRERHAAAEIEIDDDTPTSNDSAVIVLAAGREHAAEDVRLVRDHEQHHARLRVAGCWYRLRDPDAGVRAYSDEHGSWKFWVGFYNHKAVCKYSGLRITELVRSASEPEYKAYPAMMEDRVRRVLGRYPRSASGDRGLSVRPVFEFNTTRRIISVFPWRKRLGISDRAQLDCESFDRHGELRCRVCHGPAHRTRFSPYKHEPGDGRARVWVRCERPGPDCPTGEQVFRCVLDWRTILPISRGSKLYMALRTSDLEYERSHHLARMRNNDSADHHITRPRTIGIGWQQLHATASVLIDWILAYERNGWLPGSRSRNDQPPVRPSDEHLAAATRRFALYRHTEGLLNSGERYPGHGRERPLVRPRPRRAERTRDDVTDTITAVERTRQTRERRERNQRDSAPHRPRGRHARTRVAEQEGELATHSAPNSPPDRPQIPF
jgi:hypothetical protein